MRPSLVLWLIWIGVAEAKPRTAAPEEDPIAIVGLLVREGEWERASEVLAGIPTEDGGSDPSRLWMLRGLVELHEKKAIAASVSFQRALETANTGRELLELHLARALLAAKDPERALEALHRTGELGDSLPGTWLLRAQACEEIGRWDEAWNALETGALRLPDQPDLRRQQVFLLVRLGLFREARAHGEALLARPDAGAEDAIAISEALRRGGDTGEAMAILEAALLRDGNDRDLLVQAARTAIDDGQSRNAGRFLERAATIDPGLALESAEAYRRAGELEAALRMNGQVTDPAAKARQRLGLLLEGEEWERAVALEERLVRLDLGDDDGIAYGLAYAWFHLGAFDRSERWLATIGDPESYARATQLRVAMAACVSGGACP